VFARQLGLADHGRHALILRILAEVLLDARFGRHQEAAVVGAVGFDGRQEVGLLPLLVALLVLFAALLLLPVESIRAFYLLLDRLVVGRFGGGEARE